MDHGDVETDSGGSGLADVPTEEHNSSNLREDEPCWVWIQGGRF